jgi:flagellar basal-body rod modification protein FlgD
MSSVTATSSNSASSTDSTASSNSSSGQDYKTMFMQLMVAQLRNQDPLNPTDSNEYIAELAQLQQLEQSVNTGEDIAAIREYLEGAMGINNSTSKS